MKDYIKYNSFFNHVFKQDVGNIQLTHANLFRFCLHAYFFTNDIAYDPSTDEKATLPPASILDSSGKLMICE